MKNLPYDNPAQRNEGEYHYLSKFNCPTTDQSGETMYTIYGKPNCPFCDQAKEILASKGIPYTYVNIQENPDAHHYVTDVLKARTVPQILKNNPVEYIGGFEALQEHLRNESFSEDIWD